MFSPDEGSCRAFSTRNNRCEFLAPYGVIFQSDFQSYFKTPILGAPLSYYSTIVSYDFQPFKAGNRKAQN